MRVSVWLDGRGPASRGVDLPRRPRNGGVESVQDPSRESGRLSDS